MIYCNAGHVVYVDIIHKNYLFHNFLLNCVTLLRGLRNGRCFSMLKNAKSCILDLIT